MTERAALPPLHALAHDVAVLLKARRETVAVAESSAGGLVSAALLAVPGASAYFLGGAVVYSRRAGKALMGLTAADMEGMRAETEPYARMMAARVRDMHRATWGLCESGAAGPSGSPYGDAAGHVCVAVAGGPDDGIVQSRTLATGLPDRPVNMDLFARELLRQFDEVLRSPAAPP
jgi:PncC family amidohydrolase